VSPERRAPSADDPGADLCVVPGCGAAAERHLALAEARKVFPNLPEKGRRAPLCRDHYREWKKSTKATRRLDRLGW
jgi:hypothetical protein